MNAISPPVVGAPGALRILAITSLYPRTGTAAEMPYHRAQFRALAQQQELRVIAPVPWTSALRKLWRLGLPPRRTRNEDGVWVDHPWYLYPPKILRQHYGQCYLRSIRSSVRGLLREFRPQVLLSCWAHPDGWATAVIAREAQLPVVIKVLGSDVLVLPKQGRRGMQVAEGLRAADAVIAVNPALADAVVRLGVEAGRVHVIPNGVDTSLFQPGDQGAARARLGLPRDEKILLFVGNLLLSKGAGVLLEACGRLRERRLPFHCYLVGRGRDRPHLEAMIARLGLQERVTLAGCFLQEQLPDWYQASDVVTLPSFSEGLPDVLREALMCGRPFVATRVGGIPDIAHPSWSRLVEPGAVAELAEAMADMLAAPPLVDGAWVRQRTISWEESAQRIADLCRATLAGPSLSRCRRLACATS